jgi:ABC-type transport system involved in multi-copper enzyme maturation permease subunit
MTFLPIVERELRVAARRRGTYGMRMKIAAAATLAFAACFLAGRIAPSFSFGKNLFWGLSGLCMLFCLAAGRLMTADCLSREKRDGTLGLLFLTDLKGYDVVLGKLVATSLDGFYGLLAVFPLLAIPLLAGGMTSGELWRMALVLVNTFLFSLAIGLFVSAVCRDERKAMAANIALLLLLAAVPPAFGGILMISGPGPGTRPMIHEFFYSSPVYSFWQCADAVYNKSPGHFWHSVAITFTFTLLLVFLACLVAPRAWQDKSLSPYSRKSKAQRPSRWRREGTVENATRFRQRLLAVNAYFWLAARPYLKASYVWTSILCLAIWWFFTTLMIGHTDEAANFAIAVLLNGMLKLWITTEAGHQLAQDKKAGAFELLLSTPLTAADIVRGQWLALRRQFLKPVVAAVFLELLLMLSIPNFQLRHNARARSFWLAAIFMLLADVITLGWVAMSAALTEKSHDRATLKTTACVLVLPWLLFAAVEPATLLWIILISRNPWEPAWTYYLAWWFGLGVFLDLFFLLRARRRVRASFRQLALEPFTPGARFASLPGWPTGSPDRKTPLRAKLRRLAVAGLVLLAVGAAAVAYAIRALRVDTPKPVVVSISQSSHPVRVFPGQGGFLFILSDGTLWRWVRPWGWAPQAGIIQPQQVGTNRHWVQAALDNPNAVALRADGTLWAWEIQTQEPIQVGSDQDWVQACAGANFVLARKRDGTLWDKGAYENLGIGPAPNGFYYGYNGRSFRGDSPVMAQVGTNRDWKAISTGGSSANVLALRADGTLWTWGNFFFFKHGMSFHTNNPVPTQICRESNWVAFSDGSSRSALNQAGQWWSFFPFTGLAGPDVPVAAIGRLISSNDDMAAFGPFFSTQWNYAAYEIRPGGTIWVTPMAPYSWPLLSPVAPPLRFGRRSDWISVWGTSGTLLGLTSDGTLWTWGTDYGQQWHPDFGERLGVVKAAISNAFGATSPAWQYDQWGGYRTRKEPRPLLRLLLTNSVTPGPP